MVKDLDTEMAECRGINLSVSNYSRHRVQSLLVFSPSFCPVCHLHSRERSLLQLHQRPEVRFAPDGPVAPWKYQSRTLFNGTVRVLSSASLSGDCPVDVGAFSSAVDLGFFPLSLRSTCPKLRSGSTMSRTSRFRFFTSVRENDVISWNGTHVSPPGRSWGVRCSGRLTRERSNGMK